MSWLEGRLTDIDIVSSLLLDVMIILISAFHFIMGTQSLFMITITIAVFHQYHHYRYHVEHCSASGTVGALTDIGTKSDVCRVDSLLILDDRHHQDLVLFLC